MRPDSSWRQLHLPGDDPLRPNIHNTFAPRQCALPARQQRPGTLSNLAQSSPQQKRSPDRSYRVLPCTPAEWRHPQRSVPADLLCPGCVRYGMMPDLLTRPSVGLIPTRPLQEAGIVTEPSVSVPTATAQRLAETATAEPSWSPRIPIQYIGVQGQASPAAPPAGSVWGAEICPLAQIRLSQNNRSCRAQSLHKKGIRRGN